MFQIIGTYRGKSEEIDTAETAREARYLVTEYAMAYGQGWSFEIVEDGQFVFSATTEGA